MALLDVVLDYDCNLKCSYCTITDEMRRRRLDGKAVAAHIVQAAARGVRALSITGGEPTIRNDLIPLVRFARERGFTDIKIQSNGLLYSQKDYVARLLAAGATQFHVSVHGHSGPDGRLYADITRGGIEAHGQMLGGIANLIAAGIAPVVDLIMMRSTFEGLLDGMRDLHGRGVHSFRLWLVSLTDNNRDNIESLPRISDMLPAMISCFEYARANGLELQSLHVPRCLVPGWEGQVYHPGFGEDVTVVTPDAVFPLSRSRLGGQRKTARCDGCRWHSRCPGLRDDYLERWGDGEIAAVMEQV